jgi:cell division septation protein DedD
MPRHLCLLLAVWPLAACAALGSGTDSRSATAEARATAPVVSVEQRLERIEHDLAVLQIEFLEMGGMGERVSRLEVMEARLAAAERAAALAADQARRALALARAGESPAPVETADAEPAGAGTAQAAIPSTPPPPASPAPAQNGTPPEALFAVHLASYRQAGDAVRGWRQLEARHGDALAGLTPRVARISLGERGVFFRLKAGPFPERDDAAIACDRLESEGVSCAVMDFTGEALEAVRDDGA